jgi:uncharacterized protein involved in exopolysaccharide biosynthesis
MNEIENKSVEPISGDVELMKILTLLWDKRKLIAIITGAFTFIGIIYAFFIATPMYKSTTTLYPANQEKGSISQLQVIAAQFGISGMGSSNNYNIPDVVRSRRLRKNIIEKKWNTAKFPGEQIYLYDFWGIEDDNLIIRKELALEKLSELISVGSDDETGLITIGILTEEPQLSADIVNFISDKVTQYILKEQQNHGKKNRIFIEKRLIETKKELTRAEESLKDFLEKNRVITESPEIKLEYNRLQRKITIKQEVYITLEQQKELAMIEEVKDTPIVNILDVGEKPIKKAKPKRALILIVFMLIGFIIGIMSCFIKIPFTNDKTEPSEAV